MTILSEYSRHKVETSLDGENGDIPQNRQGAWRGILALPKVMNLYSWPNDIVLDCFMGSGTTGVACKILIVSLSALKKTMKLILRLLKSGLVYNYPHNAQVPKTILILIIDGWVLVAVDAGVRLVKNSSFINQYEKRDEYYTPKILVEPILQYIPNNKRIWCPFDTENSEFVKAFEERGILLFIVI